MTTTKSIIIFGPTGNVGAAAARSSQEHGAKVILAMRDPSKQISGLNAAQEQAGGFERVQADLTSPDSIHAAVTKTGAKRAFIYLAHGSPDNMKASISALKSAGIEFVVFLSSGGVVGNPRSTSQTNYIAWTHAQVEINLEEAFGANGYVAVRPMYFAANSFRWKDMISNGEVKTVYPDAIFDWISPDDIGRVCGSLLIGGVQTNGQSNVVTLSGPSLISQRDAVGVIGKVIGKEIKVTGLDEQEGLDAMIKSGMPEGMAKVLIGIFSTRAAGKEEIPPYEGETYAEALGNTEKYTSRQPAKFEEWVKENQSGFAA